MHQPRQLVLPSASPGHDDGEDQRAKGRQRVKDEDLAHGRGDGQEDGVEKKGGVGQRKVDALQQRAVLGGGE